MVTIPNVAILTGGGDRPYAIGLAHSLIELGLIFDFIGSDEVDSSNLHDNPLVSFLNLRGNESPNANTGQKIKRIILYYSRLLTYAVTSQAPLFHILWNNKFEYFDRTLLLLFYRLCGKRIVFTVHNVNIRKRDGGDTWLNRSTLRIQYRLVSHIFVHTERMKQELLSEFNVGTEKISVIPFGINNTVANTSLTSSQARQKLGLKPENKVVLFFGNIAPYKGLQWLVEAVATLVKNLPDLRLVIAGRLKCTADYWANIQRQIAEPELARHVVTHIDYVPDAETEIYFKAADVLALPYTHIYQSGVLFLGYNFGLPVIASNVGTLKEDIVEGRTGLVCQPENAKDLALCITNYFSGPIFRELPARREEIRTIAHQQHSWSEVARITCEIYQACTRSSHFTQIKR